MSVLYQMSSGSHSADPSSTNPQYLESISPLGAATNISASPQYHVRASFHDNVRRLSPQELESGMVHSSQGSSACDPSLKAFYTNIVPSISASSPLPIDSNKAASCLPAPWFPETSCGPNVLCANPMPPKTNKSHVHKTV